MQKKLLLYIIVVCALLGPTATAQRVQGLQGHRAGALMTVSYDLRLDDLRLKSNQMLAYTPVLADTLGHRAVLPAVLITGRSQHYYYVRNNGSLHYPDAREYQARRTQAVSYSQSVPYADWMALATLSLRVDECGCGGDPLTQTEVARTTIDRPPFSPQFRFAFVTPQVELRKEREISGRANVEFIVDKWDVVEDYRNNYAEYAKIRASIDTVRQDPDARIVGIWLKGFASPESPYAHNTMLAQNRVAAIKQYVQRLYGIADSLMTTQYEPEDWQGLRQFVSTSGLEHKAEILQLIDTQMDPDEREDRIKRLYPSEYQLMLTTWYPALRHTDYKIQYVISNFTDPQRCLELARTAPQKLSLNEFYVAAQQLEPGTGEYNDLFELAARMYPDSQVANLNAANAALSRGDEATARRRLARAPQSPEAQNARGVLLALQGHYQKAQQLLTEAAASGLSQAAHNLGQVKQMAQQAPATEQPATTK